MAAGHVAALLACFRAGAQTCVIGLYEGASATHYIGA